MPNPTLVREIMTTPATTIDQNATVRDAARLMQERNIGACPVVDARGELVGIITEGDFTGMARCVPFSLELAPVIFGHRVATPEELAAIYAQAATMKVDQAMTLPCVSVTEDMRIGQAVKLMLDENIKHVPVVSGTRVVGMLSRHDLLKLLATP